MNTVMAYSSTHGRDLSERAEEITKFCPIKVFKATTTDQLKTFILQLSDESITKTNWAFFNILDNELYWFTVE